MASKKANENKPLQPEMQGGDSKFDRLNVLPTQKLPGLAGFCHQNKEQPKMTQSRRKTNQSSDAASPRAMPRQMDFLDRISLTKIVISTLVPAAEVAQLATDIAPSEASDVCGPASLKFESELAALVQVMSSPPHDGDEAAAAASIRGTPTDCAEDGPEAKPDDQIEALPAHAGAGILPSVGLIGFVPPEQVTKDYLLKVIDAIPDESASRKRVLKASIEKISKIVEKNRRLLAGAPPWSCLGQNRVIYSQPPKVFGMEKRNFQNMVNDVRVVFRAAGLHADSGHGRNRLSPAWAALYGLLTDDQQKRLIRFLRFLTLRGIEPEAVTPDAIEAFDVWVRNEILEADPCKLVRCVASNWASAQKSVPGWPQVILTWGGMRDHYSIPFDQFPASFQIEVAAFERGLMPLSVTGTSNPFAGLQVDPCQPARRLGIPATGFQRGGPRRVTSDRTVQARMQQIRFAASGLVLSGQVPLEQVRSLQDLVHPIDRPLAILNWHVKRDQDRKRRKGDADPEIGSIHLTRIGETLTYIAQRAARLSEDEFEQLCKLVGQVKPKLQCEMTPKNRAALEKLFEMPFYGLLMNLPKSWIDEIKSKGFDQSKGPTQAMYAIAMLILLFLPLRRKNLLELRLDENIVYGGPRRLPVRIHIPADRVKNRRTINWPIPPEAAPLLDLYIRIYRPLLLEREDNPYLFPGKGSGHRNESAFGSLLAERVTSYVGADFYPHLARHFAAVRYLRGHPGEYGIVADMLGHKSIEITRKFYCGLETDAAARRANDLLKEDCRRSRLQGRSPAKLPPTKKSLPKGDKQ